MEDGAFRLKMMVEYKNSNQFGLCGSSIATICPQHALRLCEASETAVRAGCELRERPLLHDTPLVDDAHLICGSDSGEAVRYDNDARGAAARGVLLCEQRIDRVLHHALALAVQRTCCFCKNRGGVSRKRRVCVYIFLRLHQASACPPTHQGLHG